MGPGFRVYLKENLVPFAVSFQAEQIVDVETRYEMGENAPIGIGKGKWIWKLRLEELIPAGNAEAMDPEGGFALRLETDTIKETYYQCHWNSIHREFTRQGLRRIRTGISVFRKEEKVG
jgi:hypothetical protein